MFPSTGNLCLVRHSPTQTAVKASYKGVAFLLHGGGARKHVAPNYVYGFLKMLFPSFLFTHLKITFPFKKTVLLKCASARPPALPRCHSAYAALAAGKALEVNTPKSAIDGSQEHPA